MARDRRDLSQIFREKLKVKHVYYQQPAPNMLQYPCVIYELDRRDTIHADDRVYRDMNRFTVTLIGKDVDNDALYDKMLEIPYCQSERRFVNDGLYHDVFTIYY